MRSKLRSAKLAVATELSKTQRPHINILAKSK
ncbi:MAG: hypothetical protein MRERV_25c004 [Mycoplasmataceae bacterium RV_VA103A]|nr:MAG: hypothetical protein MRERV_25c004 [Mycoplasmataceae bacterium RV_VA103A]